MKIGELASAANTQADTIRYYERAGLLPKTARTEGNYRVYEAAHVERLAFIRHCRSLDMSLNEIRTLLQFRESPAKNCAEVNELLDEHIQHVTARIRELRLLEKQLKNLRQQCHEAQSVAHCGILNGLSQPSKETATVGKSQVHRVHAPDRATRT